LVNRDGRAPIGELASHFTTSEVTIRKDLEILPARGLIHRTHCGALPSREIALTDPTLRDKACAALHPHVEGKHHTSAMPKRKKPEANSDLLKGWQQIAAFLSQPESVVQRWATEGMPVKREGRYVESSREELNSWLGRESAGEPVQIATPQADLSAEDSAARRGRRMDYRYRQLAAVDHNLCTGAHTRQHVSKVAGGFRFRDVDHMVSHDAIIPAFLLVRFSGR
jgi:hypothetical protein